MREIRIANRYAKALFDFAEEKDSIESVHSDMLLIKETISQSKELKILFRNPIIKTRKKVQIINLIFKDKINKISKLYLEIITRKNREVYIHEIATQFIELYKNNKNIISAEICSAKKLDPSFIKRIISLLEEGSGANIELIENINKDLIGGFILQYDNKQFDASISTKLQNLKKEFNLNLYIRGF